MFTVVLAASAGDAAGSTITNTAQVSSATADGNPGNNSATATATIATEADLAVTKTGPATVTAGADATYTISVTNAGPSDAQGVALTDAVPTGTTFVSETHPAGWMCTDPSGAGGTLSCTLATLPAGGSATFQLALAVPSGAVGGTRIANTARVSSTTADNVPGNNSFTATATVATRADLGVTKTGPGTITAGGDATYAISVTNAGPSDAQGVRLTDAVPTGTTFVSEMHPAGWNCTDPPAAGGTLNCTLTTLPAGGSAVFQLVLHATASDTSGSTIANTAQVSSATADGTPGNSAATATATVATQADLAVTKTGPGTVTIGANATYTISVTNAGPSDAQAVTLLDAVPAGTTFVSESHPAGWTCIDPEGSGTLRCTLATLPATGSATFQVVLAVLNSDVSGSTITNTAQVSSATADGTPGNNTFTATATVTTEADLAVTKTGPGTVTPGKDATYAISVTNAGPSDAQGVQLTDAVPAGTTFVSEMHPAGWNCTDPSAAAGDMLSCTLAMLPAGGAATFQLVLAVPTNAAAGSMIANTAQVSSATPDTTPGNNSSTAKVTVAAQADVGVTKTGPQTVTAGTDATYAISVTNAGPSDAQGVQLTDAVPTGTTFVSEMHPNDWACTDPQAGPNGGGSLSCTLTTLPAGGSATFQLVLAIASGDAGGSSVTNKAQVSSATTDTNPNDKASSWKSTVATSADLGVSKTGPQTVTAGANATYAISVTNAGPSDAQNVHLTDTIPGGATFVSETHPTSWNCSDPSGAGGTLRCTPATLPAGGSATFQLVLAIASGDAGGSTVMNTAQVASDTADATPGNNSSLWTSTVATSADVRVTKTGPQTVTAGAPATYAITVTNVGPSDAQTVKLTDAVPSGASFVSVTHPSGWACTNPGENSPLTCTLAALPAGASATFQVVLGIISNDPNGSTVTNTAQVTTTTAGSNPNNESSSTSATVTTQADVRVTKTGPGTVIAGTQAFYGITVTNAGPSDAQGLQLTDAVPAGTTFVSETHPNSWKCTDPQPGPNGGMLSCTLATLPAGQSAIFGLTLAIGASAAQNSTIKNTTQVSTTTAGSNPNNLSSSVTSTVAASADLQVTKTGPASVTPATTATYTITVTNAGPSDAQGVSLTDTVTTGSTVQSMTEPTGPTFTCPSPTGNSGTCTIATLGAGQSATFQVTVLVNPNLPPSASVLNTASFNGVTPDPNRTNNSSSVLSPNSVGVLVVNGTSGNDHLVVNATGTDSGSYTLNGATAVPFSNISQFVFNGHGGNDTFTINNTADLLLAPSGGILFNNPGTSLDLLEDLGGPANTGTFTPGPTPDAGTLVHAGSTLTQTIGATGLAQVNDTVTDATSFTVFGTSAADQFQVGAGPSVAGVPTATVSSPSFATVNAGNKAALIVAGSGNDTYTVTATLAGTPTTIQSGGGFDTVNVGNATHTLAGILGPLAIEGGGNTALNVNDQGNGGTTTYTVSDTAVTSSAGPSITYANLANLTLNGGPGGNTYKVTATAVGTTTTVLTGGGADAIAVQATGFGSTTNVVGSLAGSTGPGGNDTVTITSGGSVQNILGTVNVESPGGADTITVDDSADTTAQTVSLDSVAPNSSDSEGNSDEYGTISGLAPGQINYEAPDTHSLTIDGGSGANTYDVFFTNPSEPTTVNAGTGNDTFNVDFLGATSTNTFNGQGGNDVFNVFGPTTSDATTTLNGGTGSSTLDYNAGTGLVTITPGGPGSGTVTQPGGGPVNYANLSGVNIAPSGAFLTIADTTGGEQLTVTATDHASGTYVLETANATVIASGTLGGISSLTFNAPAGGDTFTIDNPSGGLFAPAGGIAFNAGSTGNVLNDLGGSADAGSFTPNLAGTPPNAGTVTHGNASDTQTITFTGLSPYTDTVSEPAFTVNGTDHADTISYQDVLPAGSTHFNQVTDSNGEAVTFANKTAVSVAGDPKATGNADTYNVQSFQPATGLTNLAFDGGPGNDTFNVLPGSSVPITVNGGSQGTVPPGDSLNLLSSDCTGAFLSVAANHGGSLDGGYTFADCSPVNFTSIETLSPSAVVVAVAKTDNTPVAPATAAGTADPGTTVTYTVTVSNTGTLGVAPVTVSDPLPSQIDLAPRQLDLHALYRLDLRERQRHRQHRRRGRRPRRRCCRCRHLHDHGAHRVVRDGHDDQYRHHHDAARRGQQRRHHLRRHHHPDAASPDHHDQERPGHRGGRRRPDLHSVGDQRRPERRPDRDRDRHGAGRHHLRGADAADRVRLQQRAGSRRHGHLLLHRHDPGGGHLGRLHPGGQRPRLRRRRLDHQQHGHGQQPHPVHHAGPQHLQLHDEDHCERRGRRVRGQDRADERHGRHGHDLLHHAEQRRPERCPGRDAKRRAAGQHHLRLRVAGPGGRGVRLQRAGPRRHPDVRAGRPAARHLRGPERGRPRPAERRQRHHHRQHGHGDQHDARQQPEQQLRHGLDHGHRGGRRVGGEERPGDHDGRRPCHLHDQPDQHRPERRPQRRAQRRPARRHHRQQRERHGHRLHQHGHHPDVRPGDPRGRRLRHRHRGCPAQPQLGRQLDGDEHRLGHHQHGQHLDQHQFLDHLHDPGPGRRVGDQGRPPDGHCGHRCHLHADGEQRRPERCPGRDAQRHAAVRRHPRVRGADGHTVQLLRRHAGRHLLHLHCPDPGRPAHAGRHRRLGGLHRGRPRAGEHPRQCGRHLHQHGHRHLVHDRHGPGQ
jgi:uncharacterized repeat protein (TIGR01451 family)